jgi:hypothetical protein
MKKSIWQSQVLVTGAAILALLNASPAHAQKRVELQPTPIQTGAIPRWVEVGQSRQGDSLFVNTAQIISGTGRYDGFVLFTGRLEMSAQDSIVEARMAANCSSLEYITLEEKFFDRQGNLLSTYEFPLENAKAETAAPDSLRSNAINYACRR